MRAISTQADAKAHIIQESLSTEFASGKHVMGNVSFNNGLVTSSSDVRTLYYVGNKGVANVEFSVDVTLASGGVAGLLFRAKNFSYSKSLATVSRALQGYYLYITQNSIILYKYNYNTVNNVMFNYYKQLGTSTNNIKIRANQNVIELYLNGEKVKTKYDDFAFMDGYCGIYNENSSATYSNLVYKPL